MEIKEIPRGQLSTIILSTLLDGDKYGYEIIKDIEIKSGGKIKIKQPSLYSSLTRMENQKLISSYWRDSDIGGKRHYYRLTDFGRKQTEQWQNDFMNSNSVVSGLFKDGENGENFKLKEESIKEEVKQDEPKFLQQENIFSKLEKSEKKQDESTSRTSLVPDQLDIFELANKAIEEEKKKNEKIEIQEEFVPPPEKHYNVYQELNQLRKQNEISSFAENIKEDYADDDLEEIEETEFKKSFAESLKTDNNNISNVNKDLEIQKENSYNVYYENKNGPLNSNDIVENEFNENKEDNFNHNENILDNIENQTYINENQLNIAYNNSLDNEQDLTNDIELNKNEIQNLNENVIEEKQEKKDYTYSKQEKDEGIFITETPNPESLPKVKKIEPARFTIVGESPLFKYSTVENKYNELVEDLYKKGFNEKSSEGYLSYDALNEHYKKNGLKFYAYTAKEIYSQNEKSIKKVNNDFIPINKINFYKSIIYLALILFETWLSYTILSVTGAQPQQLFLYIIVTILAFCPVVYTGIMFYKNPEKQLPKDVQELKQFFINLGIAVLGILLVFSFNVLFGFNGQNFSDYSTTIVLPSVLLLNVPISYYISKELIKRF